MIRPIDNLGVTAHSLFQRSNFERVRAVVIEQMHIIDERIVAAHRAGYNKIEHELPRVFNIGSILSTVDAQTLIYSELLTIYRNDAPLGKGFKHTRILIGPTSTTMIIQWPNGMSPEDRAARQKVIIDASLDI
jgi:hypothetical protein